jgi:hypothetical protein
VRRQGIVAKQYPRLRQIASAAQAVKSSHGMRLKACGGTAAAWSAGAINSDTQKASVSRFNIVISSRVVITGLRRL